MNYFEKAVELVKEAEGFKPSEYICLAGKRTQGYGRNLEVHPLSETELNQLDSKGMVDMITAARWAKEELLGLELRLIEEPSFKECNDIRKAVLLDMAFNMGFDGLMKFKMMHKALINRDWLQAGLEMKDSKWYTQVGNRSKRNYTLMVKG